MRKISRHNKSSRLAGWRGNGVGFGRGECASENEIVALLMSYRWGRAAEPPIAKVIRLHPVISPFAALEGRSMIVGAFALATYSWVVCVLLKKLLLSSWTATVAALVAWSQAATLIEKHVRERKEKAGLPGARRGKEAAALDAAGAALHCRSSFGMHQSVR